MKLAVLVTFAALIAATTIAATGAASPSGENAHSPLPGCAPQCLPPNLTTPGDLPAGKYTTRYFFAGAMTLTFPKGWSSDEDSTGEFSASSKANPAARLIFWEDVYAVNSTAPGSWKRFGPLRQTTGGLVSWLEENPNLTTSKPATARIGVIRARLTDIGVSTQAVNDDPGCPAKACANFLGYPQWEEPYGIAGTRALTRFYFADVSYGGRQHLFVAAVEAVSRAKLSAFLPSARKVIASVRVPAKAA